MRSIGEKVKEIRTSVGLTQEDVAKSLMKPTSYVSRFESGEFEHPRIDTIQAFAKALNVKPHTLMDFGEGLQDDVRPRGAEDAPSYVPNDIPEVGLVQAGRGGFFDTQGYPLGGWPRKFHRPEDVKDPNAYVVRVEGDSMEPFLKKGHRLMCVTNQEAVQGDLVVVQLKNEEFMVKELTLKDGMIILKSLNPLHEPIVLNKKEVRAIHPVVWIKRK